MLEDADTVGFDLLVLVVGFKDSRDLARFDFSSGFLEEPGTLLEEEEEEEVEEVDGWTFLEVKEEEDAEDGTFLEEEEAVEELDAWDGWTLLLEDKLDAWGGCTLLLLDMEDEPEEEEDEDEDEDPTSGTFLATWVDGGTGVVMVLDLYNHTCTQTSTTWTSKDVLREDGFLTDRVLEV